MTMIALPLLAAAFAQDPEAPSTDPWDQEPNSGWYLGVRGGVSVPMDTKGLGWPVSMESGLEFPTLNPRVNTALGLRVTYMYNPPSVFGRETPPWAIGPLIDGRVFIRANRATEIYPVVAAGFVFGVDDETQENIVLPLITAGLGARIKPSDSSVYFAPEIGVTNAVVPYMGLAVGYSQRPKALK